MSQFEITLNEKCPFCGEIAETQLGCNAVYIDYLPSKHGKVGQIFSRADSHDISGVKAIGVMNLLDTISVHVEKHNEMPYFDTGLPSILKIG